MVNNIGHYGVNNMSFMYPVRSSVQPYNASIAISSPENTKTNSTNLIHDYLNAIGKQNLIQVKQEPVYTPSGVKDFENMVLRDVTGKVVQSVKYTQEGSKITQNVEVNAYDGSMFRKVLVNDNNLKTLTVDFKDKNGKIIAQESRTYEKIDNDTAISTHNGEEYKITGLSGHVLTIEHNGEKHLIDLDKKIADYTETVEQDKKGKITPEQKEKLISRIKNKPADVILTMDKEIDEFVFLDSDSHDGFYRDEDGKRVLKVTPNAFDHIDVHELGHAIYNMGNGKVWGETNPEYYKTHDEELKNIERTVANKDVVYTLQKYGNQSKLRGCSDITDEQGKAVGAEEVFAETYNWMNSMEVDKIQAERMLHLLQYMPKTVGLAYNGCLNI